jgi:hypothetical protein
VVLVLLTEEKDVLLAQTLIALHVLQKTNVKDVTHHFYLILMELVLLTVKTEPIKITLIKNVYPVKKVANYVHQRTIVQNVKKDYISTLEFA